MKIHTRKGAKGQRFYIGIELKRSLHAADTTDAREVAEVAKVAQFPTLSKLNRAKESNSAG
jgi:hypothetical protein